MQVETNALIGYKKTAGTDGNDAFEPLTSKIPTGTSLKMRCLADQDRKAVTVDMDCRITRLLGLKDAPYADAPAGKKMSVQLPLTEAFTCQTSAHIPAGKTLAVVSKERPNDAREPEGERGRARANDPSGNAEDYSGTEMRETVPGNRIDSSGVALAAGMPADVVVIGPALRRTIDAVDLQPQEYPCRKGDAGNRRCPGQRVTNAFNSPGVLTRP